jgi:hypothetical protein
MLKMKSVISPTLDAKGSFPIRMDEFAVIKRDVLSHLITADAAGGGAAIPMANATAGFTVGQTIVIQDSLASETCIITAVTPATSLTVAVNLVNTYMVTRGAQVTVVDLTLPITATATGGALIIPMTNTSGLRNGQRIVIEDANGAEVCIVNVVTTNTQITVTANLVNTYTVAAGGRVTLISGNPARASVSMQNPFGNGNNAAGAIICPTEDVGVNVMVVTSEVYEESAGPALPMKWTIATTANVIGQQFTVIADGQ